MPHPRTLTIRDESGPAWSLGSVDVVGQTGGMVPSQTEGYVTIGETDDGDPECEIRIEGKNAPAIAKMVAATPDLLAACRLAMATDWHDPVAFIKLGETIRAAIAKGKG